ncbi:hypothetical protein HBI79_188170 [Parastagonospora nodorum]|nr:hypothetical protein HBH75_072430 [Parastagonospora nodorum]KAH4921006.1 hypothetical protein HBI79_188170 [Parastagonospora nodorum]
MFHQVSYLILKAVSAGRVCVEGTSEEISESSEIAAFWVIAQHHLRRQATGIESRWHGNCGVQNCVVLKGLDMKSGSIVPFVVETSKSRTRPCGITNHISRVYHLSFAMDTTRRNIDL